MGKKDGFWPENWQRGDKIGCISLLIVFGIVAFTFSYFRWIAPDNLIFISWSKSFISRISNLNVEVMMLVLAVFTGTTVCFVLFVTLYYRISFSYLSILSRSSPLRVSVILLISLLSISIAFFLGNFKASLVMIPFAVTSWLVSRRLADALHRKLAMSLVYKLLHTIVGNDVAEPDLRGMRTNRLMWARLVVDVLIEARISGIRINPQVLSRVREILNQEFRRRGDIPPPAHRQNQFGMFHK